jgi:DNA-binding response OmpR family regulator
MAARILSISYDSSLRKSREWILEREGYAVASAASFGEAINFCRTELFDLVVIGHCIPSNNKQRIIAALRSVRETPVLALLEPGAPHVPEADYSVESLTGPRELTAVIKKILAKAQAA